MPSVAERATYPAVVLTVVVWVVVAAASTALRPYIPAGDPDAVLRKYTPRVNWRTTLRDAMIESSGTGKPVAVVIEDPSSSVTQAFRDLVERSRDVIERLDREFVPVRLDTMTEPAVEGLFVPLDRVAGRAVPGFQLVVLRPNGEFSGSLVASDARPRFVDTDVLAALAIMRKEATQKEPGIGTQIERAEAAALAHAGVRAKVDFASARDSLVASLQDMDFRAAGPLVRPLDALALLRLGETGVVTAYIDRLLSESHFDWVEGKFLVERNFANRAQVSSRNSVCTDADMCVLLNELSFRTGDPAFGRLANIVLASLGRRLAQGDSGSWSTADPRGRPSREAWHPDRVGEIRGIRADTVAYWNLDPGANPTLVPTPRDWRKAVADWDGWKPTMARMAARPGSGVRRGAADRVDWGCYAVARAYSLALAHPDPSVRAGFTTAARRLAAAADSIWGARHQPTGDGSETRSPADAAALALMRFARYAETGDEADLAAGAEAVRVAAQKFGLSGMASAGSVQYASAWSRPQVLDGLAPAASVLLLEARFVASQYEVGPSGDRVREEALDDLAGLASVVNRTRSNVASFVLLAFSAERWPPLLVVGEDRVATARRLRRSSGRMVLPLAGSEHAPGSYCYVGGKLTTWSPAEDVQDRP